MADPMGLAAVGKNRMATAGSVALSDFNHWMAGEQRHIYLLCLRMLRDRDEADSATQDTFLKAFRALQHNNGADIEDAGKWIIRIGVNTCLDRLRSRRWRFWRQRPAQDDEETILQLARATGPGPEASVLAGDFARRLSIALDGLSPRQRSVFILRHEEDQSLEDIGRTLGLDTGTVKSHLARALVKLREELRDLYER